MRRGLAHLAKVVRGFYKTLPEVMLPDPVHHDSCDERIVGTCHLFCKQQTAACVGSRGRIIPARNAAQRSSGNDSTKVLMIAANVDADIMRLIVFRDGCKFRVG